MPRRVCSKRLRKQPLLRRVLVGDARRLLPTGEVYPPRCPTGDIFWELLERNFVPDLSVVARRDRLIEVGLSTRD